MPFTDESKQFPHAAFIDSATLCPIFSRCAYQLPLKRCDTPPKCGGADRQIKRPPHVKTAFYALARTKKGVYVKSLGEGRTGSKHQLHKSAFQCHNSLEYVQ